MERQLQEEFKASLASEELATLKEQSIDLTFDLGERLDEIVGQELLPHIPFVRTLVGLAKLAGNVSSALLLRKVIRFYNQVADISTDERRAFLERLEGIDRERILDDLLLVIDRHDAQRKSDVHGRLFRALIQGELTKQEYLQLTHATSSINVDTVKDLRKFYADELQLDEENLQEMFPLVFLRLVGFELPGLGTFGGGSMNAKNVPLGEKYVALL